MWSAISRKKESVPHATLLLVGRSAFSFSEVNCASKPHEIVTFDRVCRSEEGSVKDVIDVFRIAKLDYELLSSVPKTDPCLLVVTLSWLETSQWPQQLQHLHSWLIQRPIKLLVTVADYQPVLIHSHTVAQMSKKQDICHQYLRTWALQQEASIVYSTSIENDQIDWQAVIRLSLGIADEQLAPPQEQFYGSQVVIYSSDSKDRILAVDPEFDYDAAVKNEIELPPLISAASTAADTHIRESLALPEAMAQTIADFERNQRSQSPPMRRVINEKDDKKLISEFFSTIAERSS